MEKTKKVLTINVSREFKFDNHNINADEDGRPKEYDGKVYISGQKLRYCLLESMKDFKSDYGVDALVSTGDAPSEDIAKDLRSDFGGYMITTSKSKSEDNKDIAGSSNKRKSPVDVDFAVSKKQSNYFDDLFVRFKNTTIKDKDNEQRINTKVFSESDVMESTMLLHVDMVGTEKRVFIEGNKFINEERVLMYSEEEKKNRLKLFVKSTSVLAGLANQSRNATNTTPDKIFISFDGKREFKKFFNLNEVERSNYLRRIGEGNYFIGDDSTEFSVQDAVESAIQYIEENFENNFVI